MRPSQTEPGADGNDADAATTAAALGRKRILSRLPEAHARALRLRAEGLGEAEMARRLGIPSEAVGPLLRVAEAKLAHLVDGEGLGPPAD